MSLKLRCEKFYAIRPVMMNEHFPNAFRCTQGMQNVDVSEEMQVVCQYRDRSMSKIW